MSIRSEQKILLVIFTLLILIASFCLGEGYPWDCSGCGRTGNTGNYCGSCAHPAPWIENTAATATVSPTPSVIPKPTSAAASKLIKVGDYLYFGRYHQTAFGIDYTPIEWLVLDVQDGKALLLSRYGLDYQPYNTIGQETTWEDSSIRSWLNGTFWEKAFNPDQRSAILATTTDNSQKQSYAVNYTNGGNNTTDHIFLLSNKEAWQYLGNNIINRCAPTDYAVKQGAKTNSSYTIDDRAAGSWWMRTPGHTRHYAALVYGDGYRRTDNISIKNIIRPALWVDLNSNII